MTWKLKAETMKEKVLGVSCVPQITSDSALQLLSLTLLTSPFNVFRVYSLHETLLHFGPPFQTQQFVFILFYFLNKTFENGLYWMLWRGSTMWLASKFPLTLISSEGPAQPICKVDTDTINYDQIFFNFNLNLNSHFHPFYSIYYDPSHTFHLIQYQFQPLLSSLTLIINTPLPLSYTLHPHHITNRLLLLTNQCKFYQYCVEVPRP